MDRNSHCSDRLIHLWTVATREGGVDRNFGVFDLVGDVLQVATREGGVDRNEPEKTITPKAYSRHPRGWRG